MSMRRRRAEVAVSLVATLLLGCGAKKKAAPVEEPEGAAAPTAEHAPAGSMAKPLTFVDLARTLDQSVVTIKTELELPQGHPDLKPWDMQPRGVGSGFVLTSNGEILTNNHVIAEARDVRVILHDGREFRAKVTGTDERTDMALLKIQGAGSLHPVSLGDSDAIDVGEWVVAIGNPFGLEHTVTAGIVSAKGRTNRDVPLRGAHGAHYWNFIQTDASINPGNSGGPLINMAGEVIGINTAIHGGGSGISFAIPINMAKQLLPALRKDGKVTRTFLGVFVHPVSPEIARKNGLKSARGAYIAEVVDGAPAAKGGIRPGDIILEFAGKPVDDKSLPWEASTAGIGQAIDVKLWRRGDGEKRVKVTMEKAPE
jgi:serine protease Do